ncbi:hypothetical protein LCGC14_3008470 [marine sediment metagenome]|uniref:Uncharacterized protein n=1 Tax=marine sediment metagenome TaxID=412755 RepID=A0A0F8XLP6_9ZZZZ
MKQVFNGEKTHATIWVCKDLDEVYTQEEYDQFSEEGKERLVKFERVQQRLEQK